MATRLEPRGEARQRDSPWDGWMGRSKQTPPPSPPPPHRAALVEQVLWLVTSPLLPTLYWVPVVIKTGVFSDRFVAFVVILVVG